MFSNDDGPHKAKTTVILNTTALVSFRWLFWLCIIDSDPCLDLSLYVGTRVKLSHQIQVWLSINCSQIICDSSCRLSCYKQQQKLGQQQESFDQQIRLLIFIILNCNIFISDLRQLSGCCFNVSKLIRKQ